MGFLLQVVTILFLKILICQGDRADEGLSAQNKLRKIHDAPALKLNDDMSKEAEKYAKKLADAGELEHAKTKDGENLAMGCSADDEMSFEEAIKMWYGEVCNPGYDFSNGDFSGATGHFTQVVWKGSKEFGIGKTTSKKNNLVCTYVVGRYRPAGNYKGQFKKNVLQGSFEKKSCSAMDSPIESQSGNEDVLEKEQEDKSKADANPTGNNEEETSEQNENESNIEAASLFKDHDGSPDATANEIGDAIADEIDKNKEKPSKAGPISKLAINIAQASAIGAHAGAKAGEEAGKKAGKKAAEEVYKSKPHRGRKRAETAVVRSKHRVNAGVSIVKETSTNQASLLVNITGERKNYTFYNTSDFIPIPAKIRGTNRTVINRTLVIPEEPRILDNVGQVSNRTLNSSTDNDRNNSIPSNNSVNQFDLTQQTNLVDGQTVDQINNAGLDVPNNEQEQLNNYNAMNIEDNNLLNNTNSANNVANNNINATVNQDNTADDSKTFFQNLTESGLSSTNSSQPSNPTNEESSENAANNQAIENRVSELVDDNLVNELANNATIENTPEFTAVPMTTNQTTIAPNGNSEAANATVYVDEPLENIPHDSMLKNISLNHKPKKPSSHHFTKLLKDNPIVRLDNKAASQRPLNVIFHNETSVQFKNASHGLPSKLKVTNSNLSAVAPEEDSTKRESQELSYEERGLAAHNIFRKIHNSKEMVLDEELNAAAEEYAKKLVEIQRLEHSKERDNAGENLAFACSTEKKEMKAEEAVKNWYAEVCEPGYNFEAGTFSGATGHFTQVVWDESTKLGIGRAMGEKDGMTCTYVVGRYKPAGNFQGKYDNNVKQGSFKPDDVCTRLDELIANIGTADDQGGGGGKNADGNNQKDSDSQNPTSPDVPNPEGSKNKSSDNPTNDGDGNTSSENNDGKGSDSNKNKNGGDGAADGEVEIEEAALTIAREEAMKAAVQVGQKIGREIGEEYYASQRDSIINSSREEITPSAKEAVETTLNTFKKRAQRKISAKFLTFLRRQVRVKKSSVNKKKNRKKKKKKKRTFDDNNHIRKSHVITVEPIRKSHVITVAPAMQANSSKKSNFQDIIKMGAKIGAIEGAKAGAIAGAKAAAEAISKGDPSGGLGDILGGNKKGDKDKNKAGGGGEQGGGDTDPAPGEKPGEEKPGKGPSGDTEPGPGDGVPVNPSAAPPIEAKNDTAGEAGGNDGADGDSSNNDDSISKDADKKLGGDMYDSLQGAVNKAIEKGGKEGARVGAEAAIKSYGCVAAKKNLIDILAHPNTRQLDNSFVTESVTNYDPNLDTTDNDLHVDSPALQKKLGREGAVVGAVEGAMAAATACVEAAGGSEGDKQQAAADGRQRGDKLVEDTSFINEIVENAIDEAKKKGACKAPKPGHATPNKMKTSKYHPPTHTGTFGKTQTPNDFAKKGLEAHNIFREINNAPALRMNTEMNRQAEEYAKLLAMNGELKHAAPEDRNNNGENLAFACTSRKDAEMRPGQAVQNWYEEVCRPGYDFNSPNTPPPATLHFTQVVWHGTRELGMGKAVSKKDGQTCTYVVARYKPAGNMGGQYGKNVEKGSFTEQDCNRLDDLIKNLDVKEGPEDKTAVVRNTTTDFDDNPDTESDTITLVDNSHRIGHRKGKVGVKTDETKLHNIKPQKNLSHSLSIIHENENATLHYADISPSEDETHVLGDRRNNATLPPKEDITNVTVPQPAQRNDVEQIILDKETNSTLLPTNNSTSTPKEEASKKRNKTPENNTIDALEEMKNVTASLFNQTKVHDILEKEKLETFISQSLDAHNRYRELHAVPQLILDGELTKQAQKYAENLAKKGLLEHDKNLADGENLAMKCIGPQESDPTGSFFTTLWYQEVCNPGFDFDDPKFSESTGHFTQIAWKSTEKLGIGRAFKNENGIKCEYVVGRYEPAGNYLEEFNDNVFQGNYDKSICENIVGAKKHATPRYTKHKSRAAKFRGLVL